MKGAGQTGWVFAEAFCNHNATLSHPEQAARLRAVLVALEDQGVLPRLRPLPFSEADDTTIALVHTPEYLRLLDGAECQYWDADTFVGQGSPRIARLAAGGVCTAAQAVRSGELTNAFCLVRPPGHHALADRAMGFCLINNVAVAAASLCADTPGSRILIVDWDVHHGNGTQAIFYESAQVMYASIHQYPFYPGSGAARETGRGAGEGYTVNKPLAPGAGDEEFLAALDEILSGPAAAFAPDVVLLSAGFDAHSRDPLGGLQVTTNGFAIASKLICDFAAAHCGQRLVSVLEGGYDLTALAETVAVHIDVLLQYANQAQREVGS